VGFAGGEGDGVAGVQLMGNAVDSHARGAFENDKKFGHVGVGVGGEDFTRRDNDACYLVEGRQTGFAEADLFLRGGIVTDLLFGRAVDAAEMQRRGQSEKRLRDEKMKRLKDKEI